MTRSRAGLQQALTQIPALREEFWQSAAVAGSGSELNMTLERAGRVADFFELGELMCRDALARDESCGCHFRQEYQTAEAEARRDDEHFCHVAAWAYRGDDQPAARLEEPLQFEAVGLAERSYK